MEGSSGKGEGEAVDHKPPLPVGNRLPPVHPPAALGYHSVSMPLGLPAGLPPVSERPLKAADDSTHNYGAAGCGNRKASTPMPRHRRSRSEDVIGGPNNNDTLQAFNSQRAWRGDGSLPKQNRKLNGNLEELANQKRQWYRLQSKAPDRTKFEEPDVLFEHLIVTGLHPDANLEDLELAFARKKKWESTMSRTLVADEKDYWFPSPPSLEPQILFKYPQGKKLPMRSKHLCAFCFPAGVKARLVERTPSLSDLAQLVYGQGYVARDDSAFVFSLKVADNTTLYGVCLLVPEIVQRSPGILGGSSPLRHPVASRYLVSAPRCYCLLTRVPFFELHFEMLNSIVSQERFNRITQFVSEVDAAGCTPTSRKSSDHINQMQAHDSSCRDHFDACMSSAIPVDSAVALSAAAAGITSDEVVPSPKADETKSPPISERDVPLGKATEAENVKRTSSCYFNSYASDALENPACESSYTESEDRTCYPGHTSLLRSGPNLGRSASSSCLSSFPCSSACSLEGEDDAYFLNNDSDFSGDLMTKDWEKENKNEFVKIVNGYYALSIPARGSQIVFRPVEHLQPIQYWRTAVTELGLEADLLSIVSQDPSVSAEVSAKVAAAEEADALSVWTTANICRALSLDNILTLLAGVLLEKQVVISCPNLGILSATVLSLIPMIRPFEWQSLLLPILPEKLMEFLDAPVPFLVGIRQRPVQFAIKASNLVYIDVNKNQMKSCEFPLLPEHKKLYGKLRLIHARLYGEKPAARKQQVYRCNEVQAEAATEFLDVMRSYMESLCADLSCNTMTSVQSDDDRPQVSVLVKDSFIDSFPEEDQPFMKLFMETQMFSVLSDSRLSRFDEQGSG